MKHLTVLLAVLAASAAGNINNRIIGGVETTIQKHPYQVSIQNMSGAHICSGSIVKVDRVLSAAHCFVLLSRTPLQVRAGSTTTGNSGGTVHPVGSIKLHPEFNKVTLDYDVAILILKKPIVISLSASPISLVSFEESSPGYGEMLNVTGWGYTAHDSKKMSDKLRVVNVTAIGRYECKKVYRNSVTQVTPRMFCSVGGNQGLLKEGGVSIPPIETPVRSTIARIYRREIAGEEIGDFCSGGDSGGPVTNGRGRLVGIVSWGPIGDIKGLPAVYTDLTCVPIRSFVDKNMA